MVYWCLVGGKRHRAYRQANIGATLYWCPKHGLIMTVTMKSGEQVTDKDMTKKQYKKFVLDKYP